MLFEYFRQFLDILLKTYLVTVLFGLASLPISSNLFKKYRIFVDIGTKLLNNTYPNHLNDFYTRPQGINFYKESNNILNNI